MIDKREEMRETTYVRIVVAAKEARRMNAERLGRGLAGDKRVTSEAIRRAFSGEVDFEFVVVDEESADARFDESDDAGLEAEAVAAPEETPLGD